MQNVRAKIELQGFAIANEDNLSHICERPLLQADEPPMPHPDRIMHREQNSKSFPDTST
ncbi:MAG: hypothetical protein PUK70_03530 [Bacteroidales bacterium]|nr:hypothetical protein [Bacteroidales bacterium]MDY6000817.1 hypothetical protein [Candidatus Cryptobacteroides sp.]